MRQPGTNLQVRSVHTPGPNRPRRISRRLPAGRRRSRGGHRLGYGQASEPAARAAGAAKMKQPRPVSLPVRYQSLGKPRVAGTGLTVALGRHTAIFVAQHPLPAGSQVELFIDWPAKLMERTPLQIDMMGTIYGSEGRSTLVAAPRRGSRCPCHRFSRGFRCSSARWDAWKRKPFGSGEGVPSGSLALAPHTKTISSLKCFAETAHV